MKFLLPLYLATSSVVICQHAIISHPKNKETRIGDGYKCYKKSSGKARGIRAKSTVEVQFFKNDDCSGGWIQKAWGNYNFTKPIQYYSVKLEKHSKKKVKAESADEETVEDSGSEASEDTDTTDDTEVKDDASTTDDDEGAGTEEAKK